MRHTGIEMGENPFLFSLTISPLSLTRQEKSLKVWGKWKGIIAQ